MADQQTNWTTYDGKTFGDQATAEAHETEVDTAIKSWMDTNLADYVADGNRLAAGKAILANMNTFVRAVRDA